MPKIPSTVLTYWKKFKKPDGTIGLNLDLMKTIRLRCYTDHAYLAKCLGYTRFEPSVHDEVWAFWLKKNPDIQPFEDFALTDLSTHDRALFQPRNGFKSTQNMVDACQYILCWPDISILFVVGKEERGLEFLGEVKGYFERQDDGLPRVINNEYSLFQLAFPDFCTDGLGKAKSFTVPCRTAVEGARQPTISFAGVETSMSGPHFDVIKFDDAITNENSRTSGRLITVRNQISLHRKMMNPFGYCDFIGTWYSPNDHYGYIIRAEEENKTLFWSKGSCDSRDVDGRPCMTRIMLRPAMWPTDEKPIDIDGPIDAKDWTLWFPQRLTWAWLMKERSTNRDMFSSQLMNNPNLSKSVRFNRVNLIKATRPYNEMPELRGGIGQIVQSWDTAYTDNITSNYTVGLTALILGGRYYIIDMVRGQFSDYDIARVIGENIAKWRPSHVVMEDALGVRWLAREIRRETQRMNFSVSIEFSEIENKKNRKMIMAAPVVKLFGEERIILSNAIPYLEALYSELEGFMNGAPNDDIVDAMSILVNYFQYLPEASEMALRSDVDEELQRRLGRSLYNHFYGIGTGNNSFENLREGLTQEEIPSWVNYDPSTNWTG
jgi:phage terminase large subunit-like protein